MVTTIDINLLPWRVDLRKGQVRAFRYLCALTVLAGLISGSAWSLLLDRQIAQQKRALLLLQTEVHKLDQQAKQKEKIAQQVQLLRSEVAELRSLSSNNTQMVRMMQGLSLAWVEGLLYRSLERSDEQLLLSGLASSSNQVAALLRNLAQASWLAQAKLGSLHKATVDADASEAQSTFYKYQFVIQILQANPAAPDSLPSS